MAGIDEQTVERFAALFPGREDAAGRLGRDGRAFQEKITGEFAPLYKRHLEGQKYPNDSLGVYPLLDAGLVRWAAADIDLGDEASAWRIADALQACGVRPYVEVSKGKGHHVWVFFAEWVGAYAARKLIQRATTETGISCEVYPKQQQVDAASPYGNFLHLPYYGHPEAQGGRYFLGRDGRTWTLQTFLDRVELSELPAWATKRDAPQSPTRERMSRGTYTGDRPACVQALIDGIVPEGQRNEALTRLAAHLITTEGDPQGESIALESALGWGLTEREAERTIRSVKESGRWYGCSGKRAVPVMASACIWEACPFHRSAERQKCGATFRIGNGDEATAEDDPPVAPLPPTFDSSVESRLLDLVAPHGFLRHYVDYCTTLSDAPPVGHLAAALVLVATALGNRVHALSFAGKYIRPNLWVTFIAPSGARKSSIMGKGLSFLLQLPGAGGRLLSNTASKEGWFDELHRSPSRLLRADEFVGLLAHLDRKHMGGAKSFLTELFASDRITDTTRGNGNVSILNPALSILSGCTPSELERFARREDFASGFLARFLFLPASDEAPAPRRIPRPRLDVEGAILKRLEWMLSLSGEITFDDAINERLCTWVDQFKQQERGNAGDAMGQLNRAFDFAIKLAMVMQVAETEPGATLWRDLDPDVVERAIALTEWLVRTTMSFVNEGLAATDFERDVRKVLQLIGSAPGGVLARWQLVKKMRMKSDDLDKIIGHLVESHELERGETVTATKTGLVYRVTGAKTSQDLGNFSNPSHHTLDRQDGGKSNLSLFRTDSIPTARSKEKGGERGKDSTLRVGNAENSDGKDLRKFPSGGKHSTKEGA